MGMMINRRRICGGERLPYDYKVEYLESTTPTGSSNNTDTYIQTDIIPYSSDTVEMHVSNLIKSNGSHFLCCAGHYNSSASYALNMVGNGWCYYFKKVIQSFQMP